MNKVLFCSTRLCLQTHPSADDGTVGKIVDDATSVVGLKIDSIIALRRRISVRVDGGPSDDLTVVVDRRILARPNSIGIRGLDDAGCSSLVIVTWTAADMRLLKSIAWPLAVDLIVPELLTTIVPPGSISVLMRNASFGEVSVAPKLLLSVMLPAVKSASVSIPRCGAAIMPELLIVTPGLAEPPFHMMEASSLPPLSMVPVSSPSTIRAAISFASQDKKISHICLPCWVQSSKAPLGKGALNLFIDIEANK